MRYCAGLTPSRLAARAIRREIILKESATLLQVARGASQNGLDSPERAPRAAFAKCSGGGGHAFPRVARHTSARLRVLTCPRNFLYNSGFSASMPAEEEQGEPAAAPDENCERQIQAGKTTQGTAFFIGSIMKTFSAKAHEVEREWYVIDATDKVLGRVASEVARRLRGKHKPEFTPHVDTGDFIIVVNASKLKVTGNKTLDKKYYRHSGYPGGIYETTFGKMQERFPGRALEKAVKGMLPKGPLGYAMIKKLKVYAEATHPHSAQQPKALEI
jgi:large subunit ribosomal protein L13